MESLVNTLGTYSTHTVESMVQKRSMEKDSKDTKDRESIDMFSSTQLQRSGEKNF